MNNESPNPVVRELVDQARESEGEIISLNFQTGKKIPPVADGKVVELPPQSEPSRILISDAPGRVSEPPRPEPINLTPFPDGYVFKWGENPAKPGSFLIYDVNSRPVAVCGLPQYADLICNAVRMLFMAAVENQRRQQQPIAATGPTQSAL